MGRPQEVSRGPLLPTQCSAGFDAVVRDYLQYKTHGTTADDRTEAAAAKLDCTQERAQLYRVTRQTKELELAKQTELLVEKRIAERGWSTVLEVMRQRVLCLADRISPRVVDMTHLETVRATIYEECHDLLEELCQSEINYTDDPPPRWRDALDEVEVERRTKREVKQFDKDGEVAA